MNDDSLIQQAAAGDRTAQGELARRSFRRVLAYCRSRVAQWADAEELTQETLIRALLELPTLRDRTRYNAWLRGIANHLCADWHRRRQRTGHQALTENETSELADPLDQAAIAEDRMLLQQRIRELPEELREVLFLFYYEEYSYEEMAVWLGVARATVSERLTRARNLLKSQLSRLRSYST